MPDSPEQRLANRLLSGIEALRQDRLDDALTELTAVCEDPALAASTDLRDIRARAHSLLADAAVRADDLDRADAAARTALTLLRALGDAAGVARVQQVWASITEARQAKADEVRRLAAAAKLRQIDLSALVERYGAKPLQLADVLVKKANAEADVGHMELALEASERALALALEADATREAVFALVSIARAAPERAPTALLDAYRRAERAHEFNLVGAVARASIAQGVQLPVQVGPNLRRSGTQNPSSDDDPEGPMG